MKRQHTVCTAERAEFAEARLDTVLRDGSTFVGYPNLDSFLAGADEAESCRIKLRR